MVNDDGERIGSIAESGLVHTGPGTVRRRGE
jgi:hypothetical protein